MDVFLVARPMGRLFSLAAEVQEGLNKRYKLYESVVPPIHLTFARISIEGELGLTQAVSRIGEAVRKIPPFLMQASGYLRFGPPHLAVGVSIVGDDKLFKLRAELVTHLGEQLVVQANDYWKPHMTLVSSTFGRQWSEEEWMSAYKVALDYSMQDECLIEELELWYPEFDPRVRVLGKFRLGLGLVELVE
ncbi:MAG: phosphoesterase HXTX [Bacillota bacterium]|nr:MAG: phosphoesterase HXTX [Bacillota bacterium]MBS3951221.1 2'-5' RNA ligase family protein [Peptococcaceae bacterium]